MAVRTVAHVKAGIVGRGLIRHTPLIGSLSGARKRCRLSSEATVITVAMAGSHVLRRGSNGSRQKGSCRELDRARPC